MSSGRELELTPEMQQHSYRMDVDEDSITNSTQKSHGTCDKQIERGRGTTNLEMEITSLCMIGQPGVSQHEVDIDKTELRRSLETKRKIRHAHVAAS